MNLQNIFCGIIFCISLAALVIACLAYTKPKIPTPRKSSIELTQQLEAYIINKFNLSPTMNQQKFLALPKDLQNIIKADAQIWREDHTVCGHGDQLH